MWPSAISARLSILRKIMLRHIKRQIVFFIVRTVAEFSSRIITMFDIREVQKVDHDPKTTYR